MTLVEGARVVANDGSGTNGSYLGKDFRAAYAPGVTLTGSGQSLALVEFDGYYTNDITSYEKAAQLPAVPLQTVLLGFNGKPGSENGEVSLDIQMAMSMAPGLQKIVVYETGPNSSPNDLLNRIATDQSANQINCSWTWGTYDPGTDQIFQQFAAQGQSFFQASGDGGAYVGAVDAPADNPWVTVVGGTTLTTSAQGAWVSETVWNFGSGSASAGGYSTIYSLPSWQAGMDMSANLGSTSQRNIPDVALVADNIENIADSGQVYQITGTSVAAPLWAGLIALANEQAAANGLPALGWLNPTLYALGKSTNYPKAFHDTTTGDNTTPASPNSYPATANYDLCTGWGTPTGSNTINLLLEVANNRVDHFIWNAIDSPLTVGSPLAVALTARSVSNTTASSFTGTVSLGAIQIQTNVLFSRDFESGTLNDWTSEGGSYTRMIDTNTGAAGTKQSLTLVGGDSANSYNGLSHGLPNLSPDRVEFYVKSATSNTASGYFVAGASKYRTNSVFHFRMDSTGAMGLTDGPGNFYGTPYSPNQWYHIRLELNWATKTIDYYVDDKPIWPNIPFCNTSLTSLAVMNLYNFDNTQAWWDQISLTRNVDTVLAVSPATSGDFSSGTWNGSVSLSETATNVILVASDSNGHTGASNPFNVAGSVATKPQITSQPASLVLNPSQSATFTVAATGSEPLSYQWLRNDNPINGATGTSYTLASVTPGDSGSLFSCLVSNPAGSATSQSAALTVRPVFGDSGMTLVNHSFRALFEGASGSTYQVEESTNLHDWAILTTLLVTNGVASFIDTNATVPWRFYRLSEMP
jgi:hypothetical protein